MEVKKSQHQYVIGPQGNAINEIFAETGVFVMMPSNADESEMITLRGPQEKLHLALAKVYEKANSVVNLVLPCPTWLHKYIIGKKGAGIQHISQDLPKVHIAFQDDGTIKVNGPPDEVEKARLDLEDQVTKLLETTAFADVMVDAKYHKHIIGSGSSTINKIKSEANVTIDIPDKDSGATVIKIEGNKANVEKARAELASMVEKMENEAKNEEKVKNSFVVRVCVAPEYHPKIIGRKGAVITKLRDDFKVKILLSKKEGDSQEEITITGLEENAKAAKKKILKIVGQYKRMDKMVVNNEVDLPKDFIRHAKIYFKTKKRVEKEDAVNLKQSSSQKNISKKIKKKKHQKNKSYSKQYRDIVKNTRIDEKLEQLLEGGEKSYDQCRLSEQLKKRNLVYSFKLMQGNNTDQTEQVDRNHSFENTNTTGSSEAEDSSKRSESKGVREVKEQDTVGLGLDLEERAHGWEKPPGGRLCGGSDKDEEKGNGKKKNKDQSESEEDKEKRENKDGKEPSKQEKIPATKESLGSWQGFSSNPPDKYVNPIGRKFVEDQTDGRDQITAILEQDREDERIAIEEITEEILEEVSEETSEHIAEELSDEITEAIAQRARQIATALAKAKEARRKAAEESAAEERRIIAAAIEEEIFKEVNEEMAVKIVEEVDEECSAAEIAAEEEEAEKMRMEEEKRRTQESEERLRERKRLEEEERRAKEEEQRLQMEEMEKEAEIAAEAEERSRQEEETRLKEKKSHDNYENLKERNRQCKEARLRWEQEILEERRKNEELRRAEQEAEKLGREKTPIPVPVPPKESTTATTGNQNENSSPSTASLKPKNPAAKQAVKRPPLFSPRKVKTPTKKSAKAPPLLSPEIKAAAHRLFRGLCGDGPSNVEDQKSLQQEDRQKRRKHNEQRLIELLDKVTNGQVIRALPVDKRQVSEDLAIPTMTAYFVNGTLAEQEAVLETLMSDVCPAMQLVPSTSSVALPVEHRLDPPFLCYQPDLNASVGMLNRGNFCFVIASLNLLMSAPQFIQAVQPVNENHFNTDARLVPFLRKIWNREVDVMVGAEQLCRLVADYTKGVQLKDDNKFDDGSQKDLHDFLLCMLRMMESEVKRGSILYSQLFGLRAIKTRTCNNPICSVRPPNPDDYVEPTLSLNIQHDTTTLEQAINMDLETDKIDGSCSCGQPYSKMTKTFCFPLPELIPVHLKRYGIIETEHQGIVQQYHFKHVHPIMPAPILVLQDCVYKLKGLAIHTGETASEGHYLTAQVIHHHDKSLSLRIVNDRNVYSVEEAADMNTFLTGGYVLIYAKTSEAAPTQRLTATKRRSEVGMEEEAAKKPKISNHDVLRQPKEGPSETQAQPVVDFIQNLNAGQQVPRTTPSLDNLQRKDYEQLHPLLGLTYTKKNKSVTVFKAEASAVLFDIILNALQPLKSIPLHGTVAKPASHKCRHINQLRQAFKEGRHELQTKIYNDLLQVSENPLLRGSMSRPEPNTGQHQGKSEESVANKSMPVNANPPVGQHQGTSAQKDSMTSGRLSTDPLVGQQENEQPKKEGSGMVSTNSSILSVL